jgi:hypothetical protein
MPIDPKTTVFHFRVRTGENNENIHCRGGITVAFIQQTNQATGQDELHAGMSVCTIADVFNKRRGRCAAIARAKKAPIGVLPTLPLAVRSHIALHMATQKWSAIEKRLKHNKLDAYARKIVGVPVQSSYLGGKNEETPA